MNLKEDKLSIFWIVLSIIIFITVELLLGGIISRFLPNFMSLPLGFMLMGLLHLMGYFVGGIIMGATFPKKRTLEPPIGAVCCVLLIYITTFFVPMTFYQYSFSKAFIASIISFVVTVAGTSLGEKLVNNFKIFTTGISKTNEFEKLKTQYQLGEAKPYNSSWQYDKEKNKEFRP